MKPLERRNAILAAAKPVFARRGYHHASVDDIIRRAGIARGTFYLYFPGKREVFATLLDELIKELGAVVRPVVLGPGRPDPLVQVRDNVARVLDTFVNEPELSRILFHEAGALDDESRAVFRTFLVHVRDMIKQSLRSGRALGIVRGCDPDVVSACVLGCVRGVVETIVQERRKGLSTLKVAEEVVRFGLTGVLAGRRLP
ncbi:MAG: TetR/AcrR family transcriptional regulator [Planctomycetia bacterium]|nr:TetR/AcrR family transcriptional regulator [Planctomycetia bacterium]